MKIDQLAVATIASALLEAHEDAFDREDVVLLSESTEDYWRGPKRQRKTHNERNRRYINSIFRELGSYYIRRAYRMEESSFWKLLSILNPWLDAQSKHLSKDSKQKGGGAKNGIISNATRLSCALRYFAGGRAEDICLVHGISHCQVFRSVWRVVDAVNVATQLKFEYPTDHEKQKEIAESFRQKSRAGFDNCAGAIDCMLVWTEQPSLTSCEDAKCGRIKFFCGRKKKYGLGLQALCDVHGRFLDLCIGHPATTSDFLAFSTSSIYFKVQEPDFLDPGLCFYGDNAYVNTEYMVTPFRNVRSGPKDDFNFYHSQVRIKIECAFGMFVNRWGLLRRAIPSSINIKKVPQLVMCLATESLSSGRSPP